MRAHCNAGVGAEVRNSVFTVSPSVITNWGLLPKSIWIVEPVRPASSIVVNTLEHSAGKKYDRHRDRVPLSGFLRDTFFQ